MRSGSGPAGPRIRELQSGDPELVGYSPKGRNMQRSLSSAPLSPEIASAAAQIAAAAAEVGSAVEEVRRLHKVGEGARWVHGLLREGANCIGHPAENL